MKNLKIFLTILLCILLLPCIVNAEECNQKSVKLKSIKLKEKSEYTEELTEATIDNNKINLDLKMYDVGDYIEYTLKVKNESDENYYFDENSLNIKSNYFDYSLSYKDNSNKIEPNTEKTIYLKVQYKKEVEKENFFSGKYIDKNNLVVNLSNTNPVFTNPLTKNNKITLILGLLLIIQVLLYFKWEKRNNKNYLLLLGLTLLIPISTNALCEVKLDINSNITIGKVKPNPCTYDGELVQGAEYVNGQYTYRYMQEYNYRMNPYGYDWINIETDGWGVILTDKDSTDDVTTKLCTSINDKPISSMSYMFGRSKSSNIDLSSFDTSNVINMERMFYGIENTEYLDLSFFDTSRVKKMDGMFISNRSLKELDLSTFDTDNVESMEFMFMFSPELKKINLSNWKLSKVKSLYDFFAECKSLINIIGLETWNTSNVENMNYMFSDCESLRELDLNNFNVSNVNNFQTMFLNCKSLTSLKLDGWNLASLQNINVSSMFRGTDSLKKLSLKNWKIPEKFTDILGCRTSSICSQSLEYIDVSGWDLSKTKNIEGLFANSYFKEIIGLETWDTSNITNMNGMFQFDYNLRELDLSSFDTRNVTSTKWMFMGDSNLKTIKVSDKFKTDNITIDNSNTMFQNCTSLIGGNGTTYDSNHVDKEYARIDKSGKPGYFTRK